MWEAALSIGGFLLLAYLGLRYVHAATSPHFQAASGSEFDPISSLYTSFSSQLDQLQQAQHAFQQQVSALSPSTTGGSGNTSNNEKNNQEAAKALMRFTMALIERKIDNDQHEQTMRQLIKTGMMNDDPIYNQQARIYSAQLDEYMKWVVEQSEALKAGWSQAIFQQAHQLMMIEREREAAKQQQQQQQAKVQPTGLEGLSVEDREEMARQMAKELIEAEEREKRNQKARSNSTGSGSSKKKK